MESTIQMQQIQQVAKQIGDILRTHKLSWNDLVRYYNPQPENSKTDVWQAVQGMWAKKKVDPLEYERTIRKELERLA